MISFEDRMALVRAGYNASQIAEFDTAPETQPDPPAGATAGATAEPPAGATAGAAAEPQAGATAGATAEPPAGATQPADFAAMMQSLNKSLSAMVAAIQAQNIKTADMQEPAKESPSDILAKLLNP